MAPHRPPTRIRGVLFDLSGTLVDAEDFPELEEIAERAGLPIDADTLAHWFRTVTAENDRRAGNMSTEEFWRQLIEGAYGRPVPARQWAEFFRRLTARPFKARLFSDARLCLESLRDLGITLGVVTNSLSAAVATEVLEAASVRDYFAVVVAAGTEGVWKPDPEIFRRAVAKLGSPPESTLYVGDQPNVSVRAAEKAGLHGVWLHRDGTGFGSQIPEITSLAEVTTRIAEIELGEDALEGGERPPNPPATPPATEGAENEPRRPYRRPG
jgi:HAD superfamily hydrolase (TIGR01509 family)